MFKTFGAQFFRYLKVKEGRHYQDSSYPFLEFPDIKDSCRLAYSTQSKILLSCFHFSAFDELLEHRKSMYSVASIEAAPWSGILFLGTNSLLRQKLCKGTGKAFREKWVRQIHKGTKIRAPGSKKTSTYEESETKWTQNEEGQERLRSHLSFTKDWWDAMWKRGACEDNESLQKPQRDSVMLAIPIDTKSQTLSVHKKAFIN